MENDDEPSTNGLPLRYEDCLDRTTGWLSIASRNLRRWPFSSSLPSDATHLDGSINHFQGIPEEILGHRRLRRLSLGWNRLVKVPDAIGKLQRLESLDLRHNQIRFISPAVGELGQLRSLFISGGCLEEVPATIGHLKRVRELALGYELRVLPASIGACRDLERLELRNNRLVKLPSSVGHLSRLQDLRVDNNSLKFLPGSLAALPKLRFIHAHGNPLTALPWFVLEMPSLLGLSLCDFCLPRSEVRGFTAACAERGLVVLWNRSLSASTFYVDWVSEQLSFCDE